MSVVFTTSKNMNVDILSKNKIFENIPIEKYPDLLAHISHRFVNFKKGDFVLKAGDTVREIGIILSGHLLVVNECETGSQSIINNIVTNQVFGEALSASQINESPFAIVCKEDTEILLLSYQDLITNTADPYHQQMVANVLKLIANKTMQMNYHLIVTSRRKIRDKLLTYLNLQKTIHQNSTFTIDLNREQLAAYLFVDRSALSFALMKLKREGVLDYYRNSFILK